MAKLSNRSFGTEFEILFTEDGWVKFIEDNRAILEDEYGQMSPEQIANEHYLEAITKIINQRGFGYWKAVDDASIVGDGYPVEIVSPPLDGKKGIAEVVAMCKFLQKYAIVNETTGLHVHIDASDFLDAPDLAEKLTSALLQFKNTEELFDKIVQEHRKGNQSDYAQGPGSFEDIITSYKAIIRKEKRELNDIISFLQDGRYRKLNLAALVKHGTMEFRQLHGTLNPELVKNWIIICMSFMDSLKETEDTFKQFLLDVKAQRNKNVEQYTFEDIDNLITQSIMYLACQGIYYRGGNMDLSKLINLSKNGFIKKPDITVGGQEYYVRDMPKSALEPLLDPQGLDYDINVGNSSVNRARTSYQFRRFTENGGYVTADDDGIEVLIPKAKVNDLMKSFASMKRVEGDKAASQETHDAEQLSQKTQNIANLTPRNVNKAIKQTQLSPLKEEIELLHKLLKK